jgi:hypothetical protein
MRKDVLIMMGGVFVALLPFLGFPRAWDAAFMVIIGFSVFALGIAVRRGNRRPMQLPPRQTSFVVPQSSAHHEA